MSLRTSPPPDAQAKARTKHITTACLGCRRRKIKCDGVTPRCSNCILYGQDCVFQHGADKRKIAPKERLQALTTYCQRLESLLAANGLPLPPAPPMHVQEPSLSLSPSQPRLESQGREGKRRSKSASNALPTHDVSSDSDLFQSMSMFNAWRDPTSHDDLVAAYVKPDPYGDDAYLYSESSPDLPLDESTHTAGTSEPDLLVDQLSGRIGSLQIAEDGQLRFYGATSNLHILHNGPLGPLSLSRSNIRSSAEDGAALLRGAGVGHHVDQAMEDHFLKLYFCWEDPTIHVVNPAVFWRERERCKGGTRTSSLYSEVLTNAICSVGALQSTRQCPDLPDPLPDFFATRAKLLLELEMDAPTISTVQSFVILSAIEAALTRDARGWLHSGMAVRLAVDLGLHLDPEPYVHAGIISTEEAMIRKVVWGGVFIHDRMWSLYVGRPVGIDDKNITVQFASLPDRNDGAEKYWVPYVDEPGSPLESVRLLDCTEELSIHNAKLCAHMTAIRETLYSDVLTTPRTVRQLYEAALLITQGLSAWEDHLPPSLVVNYYDSQTYYLPHVLQLHMQYHTVVIITNRPFFASAKLMPGLSVAELAVSRNACLESANAIAKLIQIYRRLYGLRRINIQVVHLIFTATLIHVFTACGALDQSRSEYAWKNLEVCCQALGEIGLTFKNALRALEVIMGIKTDLLRRARANTKRPNPWIDSQDPGDSFVPASKKRRPTDATDMDLLASNFGQQSSTTAEVANATFDSTLGFAATDDVYNFFDTSYDDFSIDTLFWTGYNTLELPHNPPQDH